MLLQTLPENALFLSIYSLKMQISEAVVRKCSAKKMFLEIVLRCLKPATLLKKRHWHRCFPVNFAKFLRTPFLTEHLRWLLLKYDMKKFNIIFS